jgi:hypothetical protein
LIKGRADTATLDGASQVKLGRFFVGGFSGPELGVPLGGFLPVVTGLRGPAVGTVHVVGGNPEGVVAE